jgi:hypothetical protein
VVVVQRFGPRRVGVGLVAWAILVDICVFVAWTGHRAGIPAHASGPALAAAGALTALVGLWVGWRHRVGSTLLAPLLAWTILVPFAFASGFIRFGFFDGLWHGFLSALFSGFVAAFVEGVFLIGFAVLGRVFSGIRGQQRDATTVILPPRAR